MINLIETPQRADFKAEYDITGDTLTVKLGDITEIFDFAGLPDGQAEEIEAENLPICPIISVKKENGTIDVTAICFYGADEKHLFEKGVENG